MTISKKIQKKLAKQMDDQVVNAIKPNPLQELKAAVKTIREAEERRDQITFLVAPENFGQVKGAMSQIAPSMADRVKSSSLVQRGMMYRLDESALSEPPKWEMPKPYTVASWLRDTDLLHEFRETCERESRERGLRDAVNDFVEREALRRGMENPFAVIKITDV